MTVEQGYTYLDYAASAPMSAAALAAERAYEEAPYAGANPNSLHMAGRRAAAALDGARRDIARCLGGGFRPHDVLFTSGGTESNNLAVLGVAEGMRARDRRRTKVVFSAIEHDSVLEAAPALRDRGFEVELARPSARGVVGPDALAGLLEGEAGRSCALVSVMAANNEVGTVQPVTELARVAHEAGAAFHTDAAQGFCKVPLDLSAVDAVTLAAHKIGGPVGTGALVVRGRCPLRPQGFGGGQERGLRAGTQDVRGALAFAAAATDGMTHLDERRRIVAARAERLFGRVCATGTGIRATVSPTVGGDRLPGMVSLIVGGVDSETLVLELDQAGFGVSAASACSSGSLDASHVLLAMGVPREEALCSLRVSFDERVAEEDLDRFAEALLEVARRRGGGA